MNSAAVPLQEQFAQAVAGRHDVLRVYTPPPDNQTQEVAWAGNPLPQAPYAVYIHDGQRGLHTLAVDLDTSRGDAISDAATVAHLLSSGGLRHVVCESGRPGCRHVLATFDPTLAGELVAVLAARLSAVARSLDTSPLLNLTAGAIRPPLAPHRLGGISRPVKPADPLAALAMLRQPNPPRTAHDLLARLPSPKRSHVLLGPRLAVIQRPLSSEIERLLVEGDVAHRYATRSESEAAIVLGMLDAGWSPDRIRAIAAEPSARGFAKYQEKLSRSPRGADGYLSRTITNAITFATSRPPTSSQVAKELQAVARAVLVWHPGGRTAATDRLVLLTHLRAAVAAHDLRHGLSARQCAEWSGLSDLGAVRRARASLAAAGWLVKESRPADPRAADRFLLHPPLGVGRNQHSPCLRGREGLWGFLPMPDLARRGALGPGAIEVQEILLLSGQECSVRTLARRLGHDRKTIRAHLLRLAELRLVVQTQHGWLASGRLPEDALAELPETVRVAGERQHLHHVAERAAWARRVSVAETKAGSQRSRVTQLGGTR